jgi:hypothetical protein
MLGHQTYLEYDLILMCLCVPGAITGALIELPAVGASAHANLEALTGLFAMLSHHLSTLEASQQAVADTLLHAADNPDGAAQHPQLRASDLG